MNKRIAALLLLALPLAAQSISGTLVSDGTGNPLGHATITLDDDEKGDELAEAITDEQGRFRFPHVSPGRYRLYASRRGYDSSGYQEHDGLMTAIVVRSSSTLPNITFSLTPNAVITGDISDDAGDAVGGAQVMLYRVSHPDGTEKIVSARQTQSDALGTYHFSDLAPGNYYVAVTARPWYQRRTPYERDQNPDQVPQSALDMSFPITYYAGTTDEEAATPIPLRGGDRIPVNVVLQAVPSARMFIKLPPGSGGPNISRPLQQDIFGNPAVGPNARVMAMRQSDGSLLFEPMGFAPGNYHVDLGEGSTPMHFDASGHLDAMPSATSGVPVSGSIASALPLSSALVSLEDSSSHTAATVSASGSGFRLEGVAPGNYRVRLRSGQFPLAIDRLRAVGAEVSGHSIHVTDQPVTLAIVLANDSSTVSAKADKPGVVALLVPANKDDSDLVRRAQSATDGSLLFRRVVPGQYTIIVVEEGWALDWSNTAALAPYLPHGFRIDVSAAHENSVSATLTTQAK